MIVLTIGTMFTVWMEFILLDGCEDAFIRVDPPAVSSSASPDIEAQMPFQP